MMSAAGSWQIWTQALCGLLLEWAKEKVELNNAAVSPFSYRYIKFSRLLYCGFKCHSFSLRVNDY